MERLKPIPKPFDAKKYHGLLEILFENTPEKELERHFKPIAYEILVNYEGFQNVEKGPDFSGTPFDFFGYKNGVPYIIEMKCSLKTFNTPGETQKRRMKELIALIEGLNIALLQIKLRNSKYRIFYHDDMKILFEGKQVPLEPIELWIRQRLV